MRPASPSSPEHLPAMLEEAPAQRFEAWREDGKLCCDERWYHKSHLSGIKAQPESELGDQLCRSQ